MDTIASAEDGEPLRHIQALQVFMDDKFTEGVQDKWGHVIGVSVTYSDGTSSVFGEESSSPRHLCLKLDEQIVAVIAMGIKDGNLERMRFHTSSGQEFPLWGRPKAGLPFSLEENSNELVVGLSLNAPGTQQDLGLLTLLTEKQVFLVTLPFEVHKSGKRRKTKNIPVHLATDTDVLKTTLEESIPGLVVDQVFLNPKEFHPIHGAIPFSWSELTVSVNQLPAEHVACCAPWQKQANAFKTLPDMFRQLGLRIKKIEDRAVSYKQLKALDDLCEQLIMNKMVKESRKVPVQYTTFNMYMINKHIVMPLTQPFRCSFVELCCQRSQPPMFFMSHAWSTAFCQSMKMLTFYFEVKDVNLHDLTIWICTFANNQHDLSALKEKLQDTPFVKAIQHEQCQGAIVLLDQDVTPFRRVWCILEARVCMTRAQTDKSRQFTYDTAAFIPGGCWKYRTRVGEELVSEDVEEQVAILLDQGSGRFDEISELPQRGGRFPGDLASTALKMKVQRAKASYESDRSTIMKYIEDDGGCSMLNKEIQDRFVEAAAVEYARKGNIRELKKLCFDYTRSRILNAYNSAHETLLHAAAEGDQEDVVMFVLNEYGYVGNHAIPAALHAALHAETKWGDKPIAVAQKNMFYFLLEVMIGGDHPTTANKVEAENLTLGMSSASYLADLFETNKSLTTMEMSKNKVGADGAAFMAAALYKTLSLATLEINSNSIGADGAHTIAAALRTNSCLVKLHMRANNIGDPGALAIAAALRTNSKLACLDLSANNIGAVGAWSIGAALKTNFTLASLNVSANNLRMSGVWAFAAMLKENSSLTTLDVSSAGGVASPSQNLAYCMAGALQTNSTLATLKMSFNNIKDSGAAAMGEALQVNSTLTMLGLSSNNISAGGVYAMATALKGNSSLKSLDLSSNDIDAYGAKFMAEALKINSTLTMLDLSSNNISAGVYAMATALEANSSLKSLDLSSNDIDDYGAKFMADILKEPGTLTNLRMNSNAIGDDGACAMAAALKVNHRLTSASFEGNHFNAEGRTALLKAEATLTGRRVFL